MSMKIIIYMALLNIALSIVVLPFKTSYVKRNGNIDKNSKEYNATHFMNDYFKTLLYTTIKMGNPSQEIKVLVTYEDCGYKIGLAKKCINDSNYLSYYNRNKSKDFNYTDVYPYNIYEFEEDSRSAEDSIYLYTDTKLKKTKYFNKFGFYLGSDTDKPLCGVIGLTMNDYQSYCPKLSFITNLKSKDITENYKWIIKYTSDDEGLIIIGSDMKNIISKFDEEKLFPVYSRKVIGTYPWSFNIDRVVIGDDLDEATYDEMWVEIINDFSFIIGNEKYKKFIEKYFEEEFEKEICSKTLYSTLEMPSYDYYVIECDKEKIRSELIKNFPSLTFISKSLGTDIYFEGKQLFTETKYKYFFNVMFPYYGGALWIFGKLFLKNYPVMINLDQDLIEIYKEKDYKEDGGKGDSKTFSSTEITLFSILIIILMAITGVLFYYLGKSIYKMRKKRANELVDDEYEYTSKGDINRSSE